MQIFLTLRNIYHSILAIVVIIPLMLNMGAADKPGTPVIVNENAQNPYINEYKNPDVSAHRSGAGIAPQNTLMAFEKVIEEKETLGVDTFEFDVQITADGELILLHNLTYDETSNAVEEFGRENVYASELTFEEAQVLNLGENFCIDGEYPYRGLRGDDIPYNLKVATCESIIDYIESHSDGKKYRYIIEIKSKGTDGMKAADKLYSIVDERGMKDRVIWATFQPDVSLYMEKKYPDMPRSAGVVEVLQFYIYCRMNWNLNDLDVSYVALQIPYGKSAMNNFINLGTRQLINYAHKYDIAVQYWTINEAEDVKLLTENGADCVMTDYPQMAYEAVEACQ